MENAVNSGSVLKLTAPSGGVVSGTVYKIGSLIVVAQATVAEGLSFAAVPRLVLDYAKTSAQAWTEGVLLYWDDTNKVFTTTSTSNTLCGYATEVAANPSTTGRVFLTN